MPPEQPVRTRRVRVFDWECVPDDVLLALLKATKRKAAGSANVSNLESWSRAQLVTTAREVFGAYPPLSMERPLVAALVDVWLKRLDADHEALVRIAHLAQGTQPSHKRERGIPATRDGRLRLIREGLGRKVVRTAVRKEFMREHRREENREVQLVPRGEVSGPLDLVGEGTSRLRPYDHQREAWQKLDEIFTDETGGSAVLVLPTGAGKTVTALDWLFRRMQADPSLRVLWIAHQLALVDQTVRAAREIARERPVGFTRRARAIHSGGSESGTLTDAGTDFAAITFQTLIGLHKRRLRSYFRRPVFVVVDEAHHAGAETYDNALERLGGFENCIGMLGLSATPLPVQPEAALAVQRRFPRRAYEVTLHELIERGILARPRFHTVRTHQRPVGDSSSGEALRRQREVPGDMLLFLAGSEERNRIVVDEYVRDPRRWGKTIIFCVDIAMADGIAEALTERGVNEVRALHSKLPPGSRDETLDWFRAAREDAVLVAVSMLNEGVDLPDAKSAFLARPTKNRILLKQMVGRVLRGTPAGGSAEAHVVDFRDDWPSLARILGPERAIDDPGVSNEVTRGSFSPALVASFDLLFAAAWTEQPETTGDDDGIGRLEASRLSDLTLAGIYRLDDDEFPVVPVLAHQLEAFAAFMERAADARRMRSLEAFFDELPDPRPPYEHLRALRDAALKHAVKFQTTELGFGAASAVERIRAHGITQRAEQLDVIREIHETTPAHLLEPDLDRFRAAVDGLLEYGARGPDSRIPESAPDRPLVPLLEPRERKLEPILAEAAEVGRELLTYEIRGRLGSPPDLEIGWTRRVIRFAYGYHRFDAGTGRQQIRINRLLCAERRAVPDELLEFLVWHEVLHHVLLRQGHDEQFRALELAWPDAVELDGELATFHEHWNTDPAAY